MRQGKVIPGWFIDDNKVTEYYMFIWPEAKVNWNAKEEDFKRV